MLLQMSKQEINLFFLFLFFYQNNNSNEVVALEKEEIQQAVNMGNLDADKEYQSNPLMFTNSEKRWRYKIRLFM